MFRGSLSDIPAQAVVPEQLTGYVQAVSGRRGVLCGEYPLYLPPRPVFFEGEDGIPPEDESAVLVVYPQSGDPLQASLSAALLSLAALIKEEGRTYSRLTLLSPAHPDHDAAGRAGLLLERAASHTDFYWQIPLPAPRPASKLRSLVARAGREVSVRAEPWSDDCAALVRHYLDTRPLPPGTRAVFAALSRYVESGGGRLLAARRENNGLAGFVLGDFSSLHTAFYMFAFRWPDAPPGTADLLLTRLMRHGESLGQIRMNLGLGISPSIAFFKRKWGAFPLLPYVETWWTFGSRG